ncbi:MAG TPA: alpha/beta hydrolase-fold protein [Acidimicrobiales bacterium]|nr:alpha/beta hydrolase-fold protein [Acidimicrobiales bacterium]
MDPAGAVESETGPRVNRRRALAWMAGTAATVVGAGALGTELVSRGVLPGQQVLRQLEGACAVSVPKAVFSGLGPAFSGRFASQARRRTVGYTIAYPPGHGPGSNLPLVVALHGFGANHGDVLSGMSLAQALALRVDGAPLRPMALVAADGGGGYWHAHRGDDPMAMVVEELIPRCRERGLGLAPQPIGIMGVSMGGYGALLMAEKHPELFVAVAAISPAVWTSYGEARGANAGAYSSASDFAANDVVSHAQALHRTPVRVASGLSDPFHPGVVALVKVLAPGAVIDLSPGCHSGPFFRSQEPASFSFLSRHLAPSTVF